MKRTIRLVDSDSRIVVLTICYLCIIRDLLETVSTGAMLEKDLMKSFYVKKDTDNE